MNKTIINLILMAITISLTGMVEAKSLEEMQKEQIFYDEYADIQKRTKDVSGFQKERELKTCAEKNNYVCQYELGNYYYQEENYTAALEMYLTCSDKLSNLIDARISDMYYRGEGTIQDFDKAIHFMERSFFEKEMPYYIKAKEAAFISHVYYKKSYLGLIAKSGTGVNSFSYNEMRTYAWARVAQSLGYKEFRYHDGSIQKLESFLQVEQEILAKNGWLHEANELAKNYRRKLDKIIKQ